MSRSRIRRILAVAGPVVAVFAAAPACSATSGTVSAYSSPPPAAAGSVRETSSADSAPAPALQISSPVDKGTVGYPQVVRGTVSGLEADRRLWAVVVPLRSPAYHPQGGAIPVASDGSWAMASCYFGQPMTTNEEFQLVIVSATQQASAILRDYLTTANTTREYPGLPELPEGAIPLKTITVTRR